MRIELIYDRDCPNVTQTRANLAAALAEVGLPQTWEELLSDEAGFPENYRSYGSPAVLVDGKDVAGVEPGPNGSCCRLYAGNDTFREGAPSVALLVRALGQAGGRSIGTITAGLPQRSWLQALAVVPAFLVSLLPNLACPACWPLYAGLLSSVGLGFLADGAYLLPVTATLLLAVLFSFSWRARTRHGFGPLVIGLIGAAAILLGKFALNWAALWTSGVAMLIGAAVWNTWPRGGRLGQGTARSACLGCTPASCDVRGQTTGNIGS